MRRPADWRRLGRRLLYPHPAVVALCVPAGAAGLAYVFLVAGSDSPAAYPLYLFSAYALTILCAGTVRAAGRLAARVRQVPLVRRLLTDLPFRARAGLYALGDEAAGLAEKMEDGMLMGCSVEQEAVFLAGLAIGLELGRG